MDTLAMACAIGQEPRPDKPRRFGIAAVELKQLHDHPGLEIRSITVYPGRTDGDAAATFAVSLSDRWASLWDTPGDYHAWRRGEPWACREGTPEDWTHHQPAWPVYHEQTGELVRGGIRTGNGYMQVVVRPEHLDITFPMRPSRAGAAWVLHCAAEVGRPVAVEWVVP